MILYSPKAIRKSPHQVRLRGLESTSKISSIKKRKDNQDSNRSSRMKF